MTAALVAVCAVVAALAGAGATLAVERLRRRRALSAADPVRLIAFPFAGETLSEPALSAALRIARVEHATLMPVYLVLVPLAFALEVPAPTQCDAAFSMLEIVERRAARAEVAVDSRVELGRSVRHSLARLIEHERLDRIVVAAASEAGAGGFAAEDVAWLLEHAPCEVIALRPADGPALENHARGRHALATSR